MCISRIIKVIVSVSVFLPLIIQHTNRMCYMVYCYLWPVCLPAPYFSTLCLKGHDFRGGGIEHKMCVLIFSSTFAWNTPHSKKNSARYYRKCTSVFTSSTHISCHTLMKVEFFSRQISILKSSRISNFVNILAVGAEFMRIGGRTDRNGKAFRSFANALKNL